jgi:hypothetical protein
VCGEAGRVIMVSVLVLAWRVSQQSRTADLEVVQMKRRWGLDEGVTECGTHSVESTGLGSSFQPSTPPTSWQYSPPLILTQCKNKSRYHLYRQNDATTRVQPCGIFTKPLITNYLQRTA